MPAIAIGAIAGGIAGAGTAIGVIGGIAAGAAVGATVGQAQAARQGARAMEESAAQQRVAYQAEQRRAEVQNIRAVRQQIRSARLAQAAMTNVAAQTGGTGSSAVAGGVSSIGSQLTGNINYMAQIAEQNTAIGQAQIASSQAQGQAARAQGRAQVYGAVGDLAGTIFSAKGGWKAVLS
jgi:hypothetical protein